MSHSSRKVCANCAGRQPTIRHPSGFEKVYCGQKCLNLSWLRSRVKNPTRYSAIVLRMRLEKVVDGDTVIVSEIDRHDSRKRIRLVQIDAPEKSQQYGVQSLRHLQSMLPSGEIVYVLLLGKDKYKRDLARLFDIQGRDINRNMVKTGNAWYYGDFDKIVDHVMVSHQEKARSLGIGLWRYPNPIPPKIFRRKSKYKDRTQRRGAGETLITLP